MTKEIESAHANRKNEHIFLALKQAKQNRFSSSIFDLIRLERPAVPSVQVGEIDVSTSLLGQKFQWPFFIEAMTGGSNRALEINDQLSKVAKKYNLAMAVGSQSIALKEPKTAKSFEIVRNNNPEGFIMANIGIGHDYKHAQEVVDMINADALEIHINAAQELSTSDGERDFSTWLEKLKEIIANVSVPVILKEVGYGFSNDSLIQLDQLKPAAINVAGAGGTDFGLIETTRSPKTIFPVQENPDTNILSNRNIGIPTPEVLINAKNIGIKTDVIANGGIISTMDVVKSLVLGSKFVGVAGHFLDALNNHRLEQEIEVWQEQLPLLFALYNSKNIEQLQETKFLI